MDFEDVQRVWNQSRESCGIKEAPAAPLLNPDKSVLVVNAGITVFKAAMLSGLDIEATSITQPCIRTHWGSDGLFLFTMLTAIGSISELGKGLDLVRGFLKALPFDQESYFCAVDRRDDDVVAIAREFSDDRNIRFQRGNTPAYWTRWQFGSGEDLVGRGLTIIAQDNDGQRHSLGNIILVEHNPSGCQYFDIGFGLERIVSIFHNGDFWTASRWNKSIYAICDLGFSESDARQIANHLVAIHKLIAEGAAPGPKGAGYLTRKLIRQAVDQTILQVSPAAQPDDAGTILLAASAILIDAKNNEVHSIIVAHVQSYISGVSKAIRRAERAARKSGVAIHELDLSGTFGIPTWAQTDALKK